MKRGNRTILNDQNNEIEIFRLPCCFHRSGHIAKVVEKSSSSGINISQLCGSQNGLIIPIICWNKNNLTLYFIKFPGIKKMHHFNFRDNEFFVQQYIDSPIHRIDILKSNKDVIDPDKLPEIINPIELSNARKWYLYEEINLQFSVVGHLKTKFKK